jgi:hypothetical protein
MMPNSASEDDDCTFAHHLHTSLLDYGRACSLGLFFAQHVSNSVLGIRDGNYLTGFFCFIARSTVTKNILLGKASKAKASKGSGTMKAV